MRQYIFLTLLIAIMLTACATDDVAREDSGPQSSILEQIPFVYRQDIQQGNVITKEMLNQLHPGLSKRQVRFIMGTPTLIDTFHQLRWDYVYTITHGWGDMESKHIYLYFNQQEQLARIEGDVQTILNSDTEPDKQEVLVSVPDYQDPHRGVLKQIAEQIGSFFDN